MWLELFGRPKAQAHSSKDKLHSAATQTHCALRNSVPMEAGSPGLDGRLPGMALGRIGVKVTAQQQRPGARKG